MPRRASPTDLTDAQWAILEPHVPPPKPGGRPPKHPRRELVDAMLYVLRGGIAWRLLPHEFPPWQTVYHSFRIWRDDGSGSTPPCASASAPRRAAIRSQAGRSSTASR